MKIHQNIESINLTLYYKGYLFLGDLHLGYEEALNRQGTLIPRFQFKDMKQQLNIIFSHLKEQNKPIQNIVLVGDIKHEFGNISLQEWRETLKVFDFLKQHCDELIIIKGNHDTVLYPIAEKRDITVKEYLEIDHILVIHGHQWTKKFEKTNNNTIIMGHEHPAIGLREAGRVERVKCFLKGSFHNRTLLVLPSFNPLLPGTDILQEQFLSPLLNQNIEDFEIFCVLENKIQPIYFGTIKDIQKVTT